MTTTRHKRGATMGRFSVDVELANNDDLAFLRRGKLRADQVRRCTVRGVVDSGAAMLVIPARVATQLGLIETGKTRVRYANQRTALRSRFGGISLTCLGRSSTFDAIVEPKRNDALIGAIVLETLDFVVDCTNQRLVPRDPKYPFYEIE